MVAKLFLFCFGWVLVDFFKYGRFCKLWGFWVVVAFFGGSFVGFWVVFGFFLWVVGLFGLFFFFLGVGVGCTLALFFRIVWGWRYSPHLRKKILNFFCLTGVVWIWYIGFRVVGGFCLLMALR